MRCDCKSVREVGVDVFDISVFNELGYWFMIWGRVTEGRDIH